MAKELVGKIPQELKAYQELSTLFESLEPGNIRTRRQRVLPDNTKLFITKNDRHEIFYIDIYRKQQEVMKKVINFAISEEGLENLELYNIQGPKIFVKIGNQTLLESSSHYPDDTYISSYPNLNVKHLGKYTKIMVGWIKELAVADHYLPSPISINFK